MKTIILIALWFPLLAHGANIKISELPLGSASTTGVNDSFPYVDAAQGITKKMTVWDIANIPTLVSGYTPKTLTENYVFVGNSSNQATGVPLSGDASIISSGALTVTTVGGSTASAVNTATVAANNAASANTAGQIVKRDGSGNFSAGTITASLTGNVTGNLTGNVTGDVTGNVTGNLSGSTVSLNGSSSGTVTITGAAAAGTWTFTLPTSGGTNGYGLTTNGSGTTSWSPILSNPMTTTGDIIYSSDNSGTPARLAKGTQYQVLQAGATLPAYGALELSQSAATTGQLPLSRGGTAKNMTAAAGGIVYTDSDSMEVTSAGTSGQYLKSNGTSAPAFTSFTAPTVQKFTSGSGTYTTPANVLYIRVRAVGGGGGGGGTGNPNGGNGGNGGDTTFGTSLISAGGGGGGANGGTGGSNVLCTVSTVSLGSAIGTALPGGYGGYGSNNIGTYNGGVGGNSYFGGGSAGGPAQNVGTLGAANTGGGGGGAGGNGTVASGAGGCAGGYVEGIISSPSATYSYSVGASGTGGTAGTSGGAGGSGGAGYLEVTEYYQ